MKEIRSIIEKISNTPSLKEKEQLLQEQKNNTVLFALLQMHASPYTQFFVAKLPTEKPNAVSKSLTGSSNFEKFVHLTNLLSTREISGHEALATVYDFFQGCDEDEKWIFKTVLLKEALNFGTSLINKVKHNWIPEFKLMLADAVQPKMWQVKFPIIAQTKLDGFRAVYLPTTQQFMGRNGKPIRNTKLNKHFEKMIAQNSAYVLDGELYSDKLSFNEISSRLNSEDKDLTDIYYCVYDVLTLPEWSKQVSNHGYRDRISFLSDQDGLLDQWKDENIKAVQGRLVYDIEDLQSYYKEKLTEGYEGLMLKDMNGKYQWKRVSVKSGIMMKLKPSDEYDGKIVGYEEGEGKYVGTLGVFVVRVDGITNLVKVGSGFSEEQRKEYWSKKDQMIGQWLKLKGFEITENNESLRFPVFLAIRDAKD